MAYTPTNDQQIVSPLYVHDGDEIRFIATGTWILHKGRVYLVTAAHVFDDIAQENLCMYGEDRLFKIHPAPPRYCSPMPITGNRITDPIDLAIVRVPKIALAKSAKYAFPFPIDLAPNDLTEEPGLRLWVLGFPGTKNRLKKMEGFVQARLLRIASEECFTILGNCEPLTQRHNIAVRYNRRHMKARDGRDITAPMLNGISGGAILSDSSSGPKLLGIVTQCHSGDQEVLIGTRVQSLKFILQEYEHHLECQLPRSEQIWPA